MNKAELQRQLELAYNKENLYVLLEPFKETLLSAPLAYVAEWKAKAGEIDFAARPDLIEVVNAVFKLDAESVMWPIMTTVLLDTDISLQAAMGMLWNRIGEYVDMPYRRGHVLGVYIEAICASGLVQVKNMGKYNHLVSTVSMGDRGQRNYSYVLPSLVPPCVKSNRKAAYDHMHVITGSSLKRHDGEVCLDHITRLSAIGYKVENRLLSMTKPKFDDKPKFKDKLGRYEKPEEIDARRKDFERFQRELPTRVKIMMEHGNEFYFGHRYDVRLRTYLKAYHFDFIGNKYCRAFVQPVKGAVVTGVEEYM